MILHGLAEVNTLRGYDLWSLMKKAERAGIKSVFNACYERAKELNRREYGSWEEAKQKLDLQNFPEWERENKTSTARLLGYYCEIKQEVNEVGDIKSQYMVVVNQKTNSCYIKWFINNGEVTFR